MSWIVCATIVNIVWTLWCARLLPSRLATHFGIKGQADRFMSKKGFAWFSILTPIVLSVFLVTLGRTIPSAEGIEPMMEHLAAGLTIFFAFLTWCIVRSNRKTPPRIDYPSLLLSIAILMTFVSFTIGGLPSSKSSQDRKSTRLNSSHSSVSRMPSSA